MIELVEDVLIVAVLIIALVVLGYDLFIWRAL
jgi:hypothetical protein